MKLQTLSQREKNLAAAVLGVALVFGSAVLFSYFREWSNQLHAGIRSKSLQLRAMRGLESQEALWKRRDTWLDAKRPRLENQDNSGLQLLNQIKNAALKYQVLLDHQAIDTPDPRGDYVSISVQLETKSSWAAVLDFLHELQTPEQFIVIESADYKIDDQDHTQMRGHLKIAKWFSPPMGSKTHL